MAKIHIIGVTQSADLVGAALHAVQNAAAVIGSQRQLEIVKPHLLANAEVTLTELPKLAELKRLIQEFFVENSIDKYKSVVVLASGDPLYYGIGNWFSKHFEHERLVFHPAISSIQMACHKMAVSLQDITVLSLHGRPLASIRTKLKNAIKLLILTDRHSHPQALARHCRDTGFEQSRITVLENLSYPHERIRTFSIEQLLDGSHANEVFEPLHVSLIEVSGLGGILPEFPGIADASYITGEVAGKGMITKREVRLCILSFLQPSNQDVIWDIGAGCGGVAVELAYWNDNAKVYAIESHQERLIHLSENQSRFGVVKNLHIIDGHAPECLSNLVLPNKVFIGGSGGDLKAILDVVWPLLPNGGLLVVSAVVSNTKKALIDFTKNLTTDEQAGMESVEVSVKRGQLINAELDYTEKLPVEVFKFTKMTEIQNVNIENELTINKSGNHE